MAPLENVGGGASPSRTLAAVLLALTVCGAMVEGGGVMSPRLLCPKLGIMVQGRGAAIPRMLMLRGGRQDDEDDQGSDSAGVDGEIDLSEAGGQEVIEQSRQGGLPSKGRGRGNKEGGQDIHNADRSRSPHEVRMLAWCNIALPAAVNSCIIC